MIMCWVALLFLRHRDATLPEDVGSNCVTHGGDSPE
jgi:hypothetical protein